jgi:hypothetical protein
MARTTHVEMRHGERWADVSGAFMLWCFDAKGVSNAGCHEGDAVAPDDRRRYAAISIPDHSPELAGYLEEWAAREGRALR